MVQISNRYPELKEWFDEHAWLALLGEGRDLSAQQEIGKAIAFVKATLLDSSALLLPEDSHLFQGLSMAAILNELHLDAPTLVAAILHPLSQQDPQLTETIKPLFPED